MFNRKIMVVLDIDVKMPGDKVPGKIGNPIMEKVGDSASGTTDTDTSPPGQGVKRGAAASNTAGKYN